MMLPETCMGTNLRETQTIGMRDVVSAVENNAVQKKLAKKYSYT